MLTTTTTTPLQARAETPESPDTTQKVVIVNGSTEMLELLETVLDAGHYDVVFVESSEHAYSQIKRVLPDLVILCIKVGGMDGFQVLSMLKLDEQTRNIPILTYASEYDGQDATDDAAEATDVEIFTPKPAMRMN
jgi:CheY-like chemotaxis protein